MEKRVIPFSPPDISELEINEVAEALRSGWITTGPRTKELERRLATYCHTSKVVCLNSATAAEGLNFRKAFKEAGFYLSGCCIWKKNALVLGRSPYQWMHEPCLYGWRADGKHQWYSDRKQTTIWEYDRPKANKDHPTMKPIGLMSYPIRNSTMTNGIVLDPFLGSGSTLIACEETERVCRGIELDPKFMDVIVKRYIEHQDGKYGDVYVIRDGQKLKFDEVATFEPETEVLADE